MRGSELKFDLVEGPLGVCVCACQRHISAVVSSSSEQQFG